MDAGVAAAAAADRHRTRPTPQRTAATSASGAAQKAQEAAETAQACGQCREDGGRYRTDGSHGCPDKSKQRLHRGHEGGKHNRCRTGEAVPMPSTAPSARTAATSKAAKTPMTKRFAATFPAGTKLLFSSGGRPHRWTKQTTRQRRDPARGVPARPAAARAGAWRSARCLPRGRPWDAFRQCRSNNLTTAQMPKHSHTISSPIPGTGGSGEIRTAQPNIRACRIDNYD